MSSTISSKEFLPMDSSSSKPRNRRDRRDRELNRTHTTGTTESSKIKEILDKAEARVVSIAQANTAAKSKLSADYKFEDSKPERYETIDLESGGVGTTQSLPAHTRVRPGTRGLSEDKRTPRTSHKQNRHRHRSKSRSPKGKSSKIREMGRVKKNELVEEKGEYEVELKDQANHDISLKKERGAGVDDDKSSSLGYYKWAPIIAMVSIFAVVLIYILIVKLVNSDNDVYCMIHNGDSLQYTTNRTLCEEEQGYNENTVSANSAWDEGAV